MDFCFDCHQDPACLHVGCEAPHAYFIPFEGDEAALGDNREKSAFFHSLCGEWDFRYYPSLLQLEDFRAPDFARAQMERIPVPRSWQTLRGRGYGRDMLRLLVEYWEENFGEKELLLETDSHSARAVSLFKRHGFTVATQFDYYRLSMKR